MGRRPLLLIGVAGQIVGLAILGAAFQFQQLASFKSDVAIGGLVIYVACFAFGLGPIFWLLISEIYPIEGPWCSHERRDGDQLGNEPGGGRDIPDPGWGSRARGNVSGCTV